MRKTEGKIEVAGKVHFFISRWATIYSPMRTGYVSAVGVDTPSG
jgi:hypothetical protein